MACDPITLATPGVRGLQPYQPGKPIAELERELGLLDIVKLASNESPLGPSPAAREAAARALHEMGRYPDGSGYALKAALAEHHGLSMSHFTLGNGSNDVLELVARAFLTPADEVIYSEHAFAVYPIVTQAVGARAVVVPARDWGNDLRAMGAAVGARTRVMFVANPNNPTGTWCAATELRALLQSLPEQVLLVVDEAYFEYVEAQDYPDTSAWISEFPNLIVTRTFSKAYGLASLRVGYAISHPAVADLLNRVRQPFNVNAVALAAAGAALGDVAHLEASRRVNREGMRQLQEGASARGLAWIPSMGNFLSIDVGRPGGEVYAALLWEGVIVRPVASYGMPSHLRVTIGREEENRRVLDALDRVLK